MSHLSLHVLQSLLPWDNKYSEAFAQSPAEHKHFAHAHLHTVKALGKLAIPLEAEDHRGDALWLPEEVDKYLADVVICAMRMANTVPGRRVDLEKVIAQRLAEKNPDTCPTPIRVFAES